MDAAAQKAETAERRPMTTREFVRALKLRAAGAKAMREAKTPLVSRGWADLP